MPCLYDYSNYDSNKNKTYCKKRGKYQPKLPSELLEMPKMAPYFFQILIPSIQLFPPSKALLVI